MFLDAVFRVLFEVRVNSTIPSAVQAPGINRFADYRLPCKPTPHRIRIHRAQLLKMQAIASANGEVWNTADMVSRGEFREPICVDSNYDDSAREVSRDHCNIWHRCPATVAPDLPEINEHRNFALANNFVEFLGAHPEGSAVVGALLCKRHIFLCPQAVSRKAEGYGRDLTVSQKILLDSYHGPFYDLSLDQCTSMKAPQKDLEVVP